MPLEQVQRGRSAARPARREGAGRRRRASRARATSTSRWSPASRSRSRRRPATKRRSARTVNGTGALVMRAERVGAERCSRGSSRWSPRPSAAARRSRSWPTSSPACFVPVVIAIAVVDVRRLGARRARAARWRTRSSTRSRCSSSPAPARSGLATPMSIMVAMGRGATMGVLFRNAEAIEVLRKVDTLVVDKTGTLTEGQAEARQRRAWRRLRRGGAPSRWRPALERGSEHPLAAAIVERRRGARRRARPRRRASSRSPARASTGTVEGHAVALGNRALLEELGVDAATLASARRGAAARRADGRCSSRSTAGSPGLLGVADPIKDSTRGGDARAPRRGPAHRDAHRRQPHDRRGGRRGSSASTR